MTHDEKKKLCEVAIPLEVLYLLGNDGYFTKDLWKSIENATIAIRELVQDA